MCGIYGIWHKNGRPVGISSLRDPVTTLRHRGPDDEGYLLANTRTGRTQLCRGDDTRPEIDLPHVEQVVLAGEGEFNLALGFRRLAIVDLSPAGHQPMSTADGEACIVFNGEIYNYIELRAELQSFGHHFRTGTDTEVILAAYRQWGPECVSRFNGMWAFALWDNSARKLFLSRDRFGVKPLYTAASQDYTFAFASEIKALLASRVVAPSPSTRAVARYIAFGSLPSHRHGETFLDGVREFPSAHSALVAHESHSHHRFWSLPDQAIADRVKSDQALCSEYTDLFADAVRLRLRSDVPIGSCLSGGLDSSSIVAAVGRFKQAESISFPTLDSFDERQHTFSAIYSGEGRWNEEKHIQDVVRHTGTTAHFVRPTAADLWDSLDQLVWHQDEPFQSTSIFAQWCVMRLARRAGVTVLLDGQGADELLGGYGPFGVVIADHLMSGQFLAAARTARQVRRVTGLNLGRPVAFSLAGHLPPTIRAGLSDLRMQTSIRTSGLRRDLRVDLNRWMHQEGGAYQELHHLDSLDGHLSYLIGEQLLDLLRHEDRSSMAFSLEARVPFLDYRLGEFVFAKAPHLRLRDGWTKWLQRMAVANSLPAEIVWRRDKVGFETPEVAWLQASRSHLLDLLSSSGESESYLDLDYARAQVPRLLGDGRGTRRLWRWINLVSWLRLHRNLPVGAA